MKKLTAIFDLDGTLTDSAEGIINGLKYTIEKEHLPELTYEQMRSCVGPPFGESLMRLLGVSKTRAEELIVVYREYFSTIGLFENTLYDGILELLETCQRNGIELWICTAKPHKYLLLILEHFQLSHYFSKVLGATMNGAFSEKSIQLAEMLKDKGAGKYIMIGDRNNDINAAKANSLISMGVLWGYGSREELQSAGADYLVESPKEAEKLLLELLQN